MLKEYSPALLLVLCLAAMMLDAPWWVLIGLAGIVAPVIVFWAWILPLIRKTSPAGYGAVDGVKDVVVGLTLSAGMVVLAVVVLIYAIGG